jgi:hypothetical protein
MSGFDSGFAGGFGPEGNPLLDHQPSNLLTSVDLRHIRQTHLAHMPDQATILRRVLTDDGFGGVTNNPLTTIATGVPCRITEAQMQDLGGQGARNVDVEKWTIRMPRGTNIKDEDFIVWASGNGEQFQVEDVKGRTNEGVLTIKAEIVA